MGLDLKVKMGCDLEMREFNDILSLAINEFGHGIEINTDMAAKRFIKFKEGSIAAYVDDYLAGYICFFNVTPQIYEKAIHHKEFIDDNLTDEDIIPFSNIQTNNILLLDIVVDKKYRKNGVSNVLLSTLQEYLKEKHLSGHIIENIFGFGITPQGVKILNSLGGVKIWNQENIVLLDLEKDVFLSLPA